MIRNLREARLKVCSSYRRANGHVYIDMTVYDSTEAEIFMQLGKHSITQPQINQKVKSEKVLPLLKNCGFEQVPVPTNYHKPHSQRSK